jgi:hypothetical protein
VVFRFVVGHAFQRQLHKVATALAVSPLRLRAAGFALHQAGVFDPVVQAMFHDGIIPVDEGRELIVLPNEQSLLAFCGFLEHKAQAGIVALVLDTREAASSALEAHASGLTQADPIERLVRSGRERLGEHRVQMVSQPADACGFRKGVQPILGKPILLAQRAKGGCSFLFLGTRERTSPLPGRIGSHLPQSALADRESTAL